MRGSWKKAVAGVALAAAGVVGIGGFLHTSAGRSILMSMGGCPVGKASAVQVEQGRMEAVANTRGTTAAPARPALGFVLDTTSAEEVRAWADARGITCTSKREGALLKCQNVPASSLPPSAKRSEAAGVNFDDVTFAFRPRDMRLVNMTTTRSNLTPEESAAGYTAISTRLEAEIGKPMTDSGEVTASYMASNNAIGALEYRFTDYMADLTAMKLPSGSISLREHYMSATE